MAVLESVIGIINVIVIIILIWAMFAIAGINFFKGKMFYCNLDDSYSHNLYLTK